MDVVPEKTIAGAMTEILHQAGTDSGYESDDEEMPDLVDVEETIDILPSRSGEMPDVLDDEEVVNLLRKVFHE